MDKIEVGEWVRFKDGIVDRIKDIIKTHGDRKLIAFEKSNSYKSDLGLEKQLKTHSKNKIELIEVGDYVNGHLVLEKNKNEIICEIDNRDGGYLSNDYVKGLEKQIKSIVTKEQFESMKYNFEEEN